MTRWVRSIVVVALALALSGSAAFAPGAAASWDRNQQLVDGFNGARGMHGLGWLGGDACVQAVAQARANDMAARGYFSHITPEGTSVFDLLNAYGCGWSGAGEIIARNNAPYDQAMWVALESFYNSDPHRAIIVSDYTVVGAALVTAADGRTYAVGVFVR